LTATAPGRTLCPHRRGLVGARHTGAAGTARRSAGGAAPWPASASSSHLSPAAFLLAAQDSLDLVAIAFPKFSDGRGFSIGRALRDQGYKGTLRASGALIPDQFAFALDCGFDEVEIGDAQAERQPEAQWLQALTMIGITYLDRGGKGSIPERRRASA
jgi:uncharacterized protein (DUF934 family)